MNNNFQDWKPVVLRKSFKQLKKEGKVPTTTIKKYNGGKNTQTNTTNMNKLYDMDYTEKVKKVSHSLKLQIMKARNNKKWTQKTLAAKVGVPVKTIQKYENGSAVPNNRLLNKLRSILGVRLKQ